MNLHIDLHIDMISSYKVIILLIFLCGCATHPSATLSLPSPSQTNTQALVITQTATIVPIGTTTEIPAPLGNIGLPFFASNPVIDNNYVYWATPDGLLYKKALRSDQNEPPILITKSVYSNGQFGALERNGDRLIFVESDQKSTIAPIGPTRWKIWALNVNTGNEKVLFQNSSGDKSLDKYSIDGNHLAAIVSGIKTQKCPFANTQLVVIEIDTEQIQEIDNTCSTNKDSGWEDVMLANDNLIARRYNNSPGVATAEIYIYQLTNDSLRKLPLSFGYPTAWVMSEGDLLAASSTNDQGPTQTVYNRSTTILSDITIGKKQEIVTPIFCPTSTSPWPVFDSQGNWLYWTNTCGIAAYDLKKNSLYIIASQKGEYEPLHDPNIYGNMIVWVHDPPDYQGTIIKSILEWSELP